MDNNRTDAYNIKRIVLIYVSAQVRKWLKVCYSSIYPKTGCATYSVATGSPYRPRLRRTAALFRFKLSSNETQTSI